MSPPDSSHVHSGCPGAQQVLDAASALFSEHGIDAVSMQDVATKAGVSKANVFHHFASKEALYIAVMRANVLGKDSNIAALIASPKPFEQRFLALLRSQLKAMLDDPLGTRLVIREVTNGNVERAKLIATQIFADKVRDRVAFFEDAKARGELRDSVDPIFCEMLLGACCMFHFNCRDVSHHITSLIGQPGPNTPEAFARAVCDALTHGLCKPAASAKRVRSAAPAVVAKAKVSQQPRSKARPAKPSRGVAKKSSKPSRRQQSPTP